MDFYPQDLLVGVFPLVFAVDAIVPDAAASAGGEGGGNGGGPTSPNKRTLFDRFLDVVAASLVDAADDAAGADGSSSLSNDRRRTVSLFRPDDDEPESSDDENDVGGVLSGMSRRRSSSTMSSSLAAGFYAGFGRRGGLVQQQQQQQAASANSPSAGAAGDSSGADPEGASYAKALTHGQGFFQRARIEAVSTKHGFPPSKDPHGTGNLPQMLSSNQRGGDGVKSALAKHPIGGIVTAGWLEKHVHALPSVILVVCTVCGGQRRQAEQDRKLRETVAHLSMMLMPKRQCTIHVVGLMLDDVSLSQGDQWSKAISHEIHQDIVRNQQQAFAAENSEVSSDPSLCVTLLRSSTDLQAQTTTGQPSSLAFRRLHQNVRDSSMVYYLRQARRSKDKLGKLLQLDQNAPPPPQLLPLIIRYCFKIAMFYEFQWKFEKSLRFMVEAYRYTMKYYEYLLSRRRRPPPQTDTSETGKAQSKSSQHSVSHTGESFEVSLTTNADNDDEFWETAVPIPDDMLYQARAIAEWLNLKLLQAGFASHTEGGLLAAANQWRHHCRLFCTIQHHRRQATVPSAGNKQGEQPEEAWWEWSYIARQRLVMSQLVERHPPKALGDLGNDWDEVIYRCSPWRTYESAVEATLRIARELDQPYVKRQLSSDDIGAGSSHSAKDRMQGRYVGGLDSEGLSPELREICKVDHRAKALEIVLRAIALYERESEKEKRGFYAEDTFTERSSSRAGARLYYLAGGILVGMERHQEAAVHLEKASKFSRGWRVLEVSIRRMLIECYEKHLPPSSYTSEESSSNEAIASMILDSYFNADMSSRDLRRALSHFASTTSGGGSLKWHHETVDEEDLSVPFLFAVSFPDRTHATAGDTVEASVLIASNLDYAVHVNSVVLLSLAGQLPIPAADLLCATNVSEGSDGGIIIQSKTSIIVSTQLKLPKDTSIIAVDDSGNGGEMQGVAGKGSFAKSARPRTAGVTSAGGARLLAQGVASQGNRVSQGWSLRFLGGKPLRCDGIRLVFFPVQVERAAGGAEAVTHIELTIRKKKPKTLANIKRTPFEEENYIASAWSRPLHLPLSRGPRTLRVLGPMPELIIKDMTEEVTGGKVVEGTVNRILLQFTAGAQERCNNIKYKVSCFSVLLTPNGSTRRLVSEEEMSQSEGAMDMMDASCRTPTLVVQGPDPSQVSDCEYGYELPQGWTLADSGQSFEGPVLPLLSCGESKFIDVNLYRPAPLIHSEAFSAESDRNIGDVSLCKTDYYITVSYRQERTSSLKTKRSTVTRGRRRRPVAGSASSESPSAVQAPDDQEEKGQEKKAEETLDEVSLEFTGSVVWGKALKASFQPGTRITCPSGKRSKSNIIKGNGESDGDEVLSLVEGHSFTTRCSFLADSAVEGLKTEIIGVRFEHNDTDKSPESLTLQSSNGSATLYSPDPSDPCRVLSIGSKLTVAYTVTPSLRSAPDSAGVKATLGTILVDWKPSSLPLPSDAQLDEGGLGEINSHGPLRLHTPSTIRFSGPACWIEVAPFEAAAESMPAAPRMGVPFALSYRIKNKTNLHQAISVRVKDSTPRDMDGLVFSGMTHGEVSLAPSETQIISYMVLATRAGRVLLPELEVSSTRYPSWIVKEASRHIHIFP